ncbi:MAG: MarR family transcriptional regulator [Alphaproteobacteria bacterium]|nr:MarR family transcriptional regulator [Alphaproteobacteria bacterium]MBV9695165.1 MarR family transcriptional regulator [Alphaproteobacteria bacterium]
MALAEKLEGAPHSKQSLRLWLRLLTCATTIEKKARAMLVERFATTLPRFDVLAALDRAPDGLTMGALSGQLLVSNGNVTAIVARLVADGLVSRTQERGDRRVLRVKLTARGRRDFRLFAAEHERWIECLLGDLGEGEVQQLLAGLARVKTSIERSGL